MLCVIGQCYFIAYFQNVHCNTTILSQHREFVLCIQVKQICWSSRTVSSCGCICLNSACLVNCLTLQCLFSDGGFLQSDECCSGGGGVLPALDDDKSLDSLDVRSH